MSVSDKNKNRGAHGDSSFMLGGLPSSSENPPALAVGSVKGIQKNQTIKKAYTIIILNDMGDEVDRQRVVAESPREALTKAYPMIFTKETP